MKYLNTLAIPLLVFASAPAFAADNPAPQEPQERTAQKLEEDPGISSGAATREATRAAQVEQQKQTMADTLKAAPSSGPGAVSQDPAIKPLRADGTRLADQVAKIADFLALCHAGEKTAAEQSEAMRELLKQYIHARETRLDTLQLNWMNLPVFGMSEEEARAAGYPCIGPHEALPLAEGPGYTSAPGRAQDRVRSAMVRAASLARHMGSSAALKHKELYAQRLSAGEPCDECPECDDGTCTEAVHTANQAKDFDCVDCPERHVA